MTVFAALSKRLRRLHPTRSATVQVGDIGLLAPLAAFLGEEAFEEALSRPLLEHERIVAPDRPLIEARNRAHELAEAARKCGRITDALELWLLVIVIDSLGSARCRLDDLCEIHWDWTREECPSFGIIRRVAKCANYLKLGLSDLRPRFYRLAEPVCFSARKLGVTRTPDELWTANEPHIAEMLATGITLRPRRRVTE